MAEPDFNSIRSLRQNPPVSIILPSEAVKRGTMEAYENISETVSEYTSGKVVEDYIADNIITPFRDAAVKFALLYAGMVFIIVGLLLLALNTTLGKGAANLATRGISGAVEGAVKGKGKKTKE